MILTPATSLRGCAESNTTRFDARSRAAASNRWIPTTPAGIDDGVVVFERRKLHARHLPPIGDVDGPASGPPIRLKTR
ncbi:MAG: hypothetical protein AAF488_07900, partial [Planctomycetota bacterium]